MPIARSLPSVLLVEDEPLVLMLTESILMEAGYETQTASHVSEGLTLLRSNAEIDVLFTDIGLGDAAGGGLTLARKAVRLRPRIHVVYASARLVTEHMRGMFVKGSRFLPKPYRKAEVLAALEEWEDVKHYDYSGHEAKRDLRPNHRP